MVIALRLAKSGWWGGDPEKVMEARAETVLTVWQYEKFLEEYQRTLIEKTKGD